MFIVFMLLASATALELLVQVRPFWRFRKVIAAIALIIGAFGAGAFVVWEPNIFSGLLVWLMLYRLFNMVRIVEGRMHEHHLRHTTRHTTGALLGMQAVVVAAWAAWNAWGDTGHMVWAAVAVTQLVVAAALVWSVTRNLRRMRWPHQDMHYSDKELPSVTVAIPARNETEDLQLCLQSVIASNYPKLEIIVLDDCSQARRTPEIIREFAHDGVRFIQGREPAADWLPKNHAYARLAEEASGAYVIFCGVDVRLAPNTIRSMVTLMLDRNKAMLGILPRRERNAYGHLSLIQAMRYWWELVPPRRLFNRPPVLSSCWAIKTDALKKVGGFAAVARTIVPEAFFARELTKTDAYSFVRASNDTGVT
ncbi:MAG TPA: glycosyltransferase family 2 protein, partial [Candidatus Saccharimonadales bacterium]|nr:glycosyltransferase family 2 protein [Candidatus Saccharimonadales bacterium]